MFLLVIQCIFRKTFYKDFVFRPYFFYWHLSYRMIMSRTIYVALIASIKFYLYIWLKAKLNSIDESEVHHLNKTMIFKLLSDRMLGTFALFIFSNFILDFFLLFINCDKVIKLWYIWSTVCNCYIVTGCNVFNVCNKIYILYGFYKEKLKYF